MTSVTSGNEFKYYQISNDKKIERDKVLKNLAVSNSLKKSQGIKTESSPSFSEVTEPYDQSLKFSGEIKEYLLAEEPLFRIPGAIEFGYGQSRTWDTDCLLDEQLNTQIIKYSLARIILAASCVKIGDRNSYQLNDFYHYIEASDKANISFIIGGVFSYLSALNWVQADNDSIKHFLNASNLAVSALHPVKGPDTKKNPDYIVLTSKGMWHVFESKGGGKAKRWQRIEEGLRQLGIVNQVGWDTDPVKNVITQVCTHARIDASKKIDVAVVDPTYDPKRALKINQSVAFLMERVACLDLFEYFTKQGTLKESKEGFPWELLHTKNFYGMELAIPKKYLEIKKSLRSKLAIYIAIRDALNDGYYFKYKEQSFLINIDIAELLGDNRDVLLNEYHLDYDKIVNNSFQDAMLEVTKQLGLDDLALQLKSHDDNLRGEISDAGLRCLSTSGMLSGTNISRPELWKEIGRKGRPRPIA